MLWCRLAEATNVHFAKVKEDYRQAGCCIKAAEDLESWALTTFGASLRGRDAHLVFVTKNKVMDTPVLYGNPGEGAMSPESTDIYASRLFKRQQGTCMWRFHCKADASKAMVAYAHRVVQLGDKFLDWGFDQFLLPVGVEVFLAM